VLGGILLSLSPIAIDVEIDMMFDSKVGVAVTKDREMELLFNKLNLVSPQNCFQLKTTTNRSAHFGSSVSLMNMFYININT